MRVYFMKMTENQEYEQRKDKHIQINLSKDVISSLSTGLEEIRLVHNALPEIALGDVDASLTLFGRKMNYPVLISSMTGGTQRSSGINQILAEVAQEFGFAMGVGSQRIALEQPETSYSFNVRKTAPDILLFANLGAVQFNYGYTVEHCRRAIDSIKADALILHLNPLQEALMDGGDTDFSGLLKKIEAVCNALEQPVVVKEVGWGISAYTASRLVEAGVRAIDVAGAGGTSWAQVEKFRSEDPLHIMIADDFRNWGIATVEALTEIRSALTETPLFASGGLKNGVDIVKCVALGAILGGLARPFLVSAAKSMNESRLMAQAITGQIKIAMFAVGAKRLSELNGEKIFKKT